MRYVTCDAAALCESPQLTEQVATDGVGPNTAGRASSKAVVEQEDSALQAGSSTADRTERPAAKAQSKAMPAALVDSSKERVEGDRLLPPGSFDTVVDTFGLCSHADPVAALQVCTLPMLSRSSWLPPEACCALKPLIT